MHPGLAVGAQLLKGGRVAPALGEAVAAVAEGVRARREPRRRRVTPVLAVGGADRGDVAEVHELAVVELDGGEMVHLGDVASIGPANRKERRDPPPRMAACAPAFGYRGHCLTKSRRYSTSFKQLRADREAWVHEQILARSSDPTQRALAEAEERTVMLEVDGIGHVTASDRYYALAEHSRARERRRIGREECGTGHRGRRATGEGGSR